MLISTPAGSTAYNLSVHGPILSLKSNKLAITPISPFRPRRWKGNIVKDTSLISIENFNYRPERRYLYSQVNDFEKLPKDIGVNLNIGHLYYTEKKLKINSYTDEMIDSVRNRIHEMHINDNDGTEALHKLVGKGDIPIRDIIKKVSKGRDTPHLIIEAHKSRHEYSDNDLIENILELNRISKV